MTRSTPAAAVRRRGVRAGRSSWTLPFLVFIGLAAAGCSSAAPSAARATTTSTTPGHDLSLAAVRSRYLAIVNPAEAPFVTFSNALGSLATTTTRSTLDAVVKPAATAIARSGRELYALRGESPTAVRAAMYAVVVDDNTVWQALEDLADNWGSRGFNYAGWQQAFSSVINQADGAESKLRRELGLRVNGS